MESWQKQQIRLIFPEFWINLAAKSKPEISRQEENFKYRSESFNIVQVSFRIVRKYRSESFSIVQVSFRIVHYRSSIVQNRSVSFSRSGQQKSFFGTFLTRFRQIAPKIPNCAQNLLPKKIGHCLSDTGLERFGGTSFFFSPKDDNVTMRVSSRIAKIKPAASVILSLSWSCNAAGTD